MSELLPVRGLIVDDHQIYIDRVASAFVEAGGLVVATAGNAFGVKDLVDNGQITPGLIDVAFLDSNLGCSMADGKEVLRLLIMNQLARRDVGLRASEDQKHDPNNAGKIVTIGTSSERERALEIGTYSDKLGRPLIVDWEERPIKLAELVSEVRRLKPRV